MIQYPAPHTSTGEACSMRATRATKPSRGLVENPLCCCEQRHRLQQLAAVSVHRPRQWSQVLPGVEHWPSASGTLPQT